MFLVIPYCFIVTLAKFIHFAKTERWRFDFRPFRPFRAYDLDLNLNLDRLYYYWNISCLIGCYTDVFGKSPIFVFPATIYLGLKGQSVPWWHWLPRILLIMYPIEIPFIYYIILQCHPM